ncbi:MAG: hypothetical protein WC758_01585 [Candidatus Woesearchaeota archaeon]|jgi:hypothetical protein
MINDANIANPEKLLSEFKFSALSDSQKKLFLNLLGYDVDGEGFIIGEDSERIKCPYTKEYVLFSKASILPGSTIIINTSAYTLSCYISDFLAGEGISGTNRPT